MNRKCYFSSRICGNCRHFRLHYVYVDGRFIPTCAGHCVHPRLKDRFAAQGCPRWETVPEEGEACEPPLAP